MMREDVGTNNEVMWGFFFEEGKAVAYLWAEGLKGVCENT